MRDVGISRACAAARANLQNTLVAPLQTGAIALGFDAAAYGT
jgi:hypothetical protein